MGEFPYSIWSKYNSEGSTNTTHTASSTNIDAKVATIAKKIANAAIRSDDTDCKDDSPVHIELPKFSKNALIFGSIILLKVLLFCSYNAARDAGLDVLDL